MRVIDAGGPRPWEDMAGFLHAAFAQAQRDLRDMQTCTGPVFFDRGIFDAASGLAHLAGQAISDVLPRSSFPYSDTVFFAPPWEAIYHQDENRRHDFAAACAEAERLAADLRRLGIVPQMLPPLPLMQRCDWVAGQIRMHR